MGARVNALLYLSRVTKRRVLLLADALLVAVSVPSAVLLHADSLAPLADPRLWGIVVVLVPLSLAVFWRLGIYRLVLRYMSHSAVPVLGMAVVASGILLALGNLLAGRPLAASVPVIHVLLLALALGGLRFLLRELAIRQAECERKPVIIYGAGAAGCELVAALRHGGEYQPVAFVDDWRGLDGSLVEGLEVHLPEALSRLIAQHRVAMVLLAIPSAPRCRRREILRDLADLSIPVQTIPGSADVIAGRARINELRDVALEDLLGREPVPPFPELMEANIRGKTVMVTGAGGSIGSELCRQIIEHAPARLLLLDCSEYALYAIEQELRRTLAAKGAWVALTPLMLSVQQVESLAPVFDGFAVQTIYHAAAYKHVPMVEHNLVQGVRNNVFGTLNLVRLALAARVETLVLISTDKAVRPTNVMGASKRLTELICQALADAQSHTRLSMVRFGNVLGSSGSVVPHFRSQIEQGGPVEVTHPEIMRYFMTIPEAAQLVIQAGAMARGGEVYVLDMGEPVKIHDLAVNMIRLSGLEVRSADQPNGDIEIAYTGLRPGEKLFEELLIGGDVSLTCHPRIMTTREVFWPWPRLERYLEALDKALGESDPARIRQMLLEAPLEYSPQAELVDLVWTARQARRPLSGSTATALDPFTFDALSFETSLDPLPRGG